MPRLKVQPCLCRQAGSPASEGLSLRGFLGQASVLTFNQAGTDPPQAEGPGLYRFC